MQILLHKWVRPMALVERMGGRLIDCLLRLIPSYKPFKHFGIMLYFG